MRKLLLTVALLTSFASAQWHNTESKDQVTDEVSYGSHLTGESTVNGNPKGGNLTLMCAVKGKALVASVIHYYAADRKPARMGTIKFRVLNDDKLNPRTEGYNYGYMFLITKDEVEKMSGSEFRSSYSDYSGNQHYFEFQIPDIKDSAAYKDCFK